MGEVHKSPHLRTGRQVRARSTHTRAPHAHVRHKPGALMNEAYKPAQELHTDTHAHTYTKFNLACLSLIYFIRNHQVSKSWLLICSSVLGINAVDKVINPIDNDLG